MAEEKSNAPTPRRLQKAREEGRVPHSRELSLLIGLGAGLLAIAACARPGGITAWLAASLRQTHADAAASLRVAAWTILLCLWPAAITAMAGYLGAGLLQTSFLLHPASLQPDLARISPLRGLKRLFAAQTLVQTLKSLVKLAVLGIGLWMAIAHALPALPGTLFAPPEALTGAILAQGSRLALLLLGAQAAVAAGDFYWERHQHGQQFRMTDQELRDEHKETEGNPKMRQRLRGLIRARARRRMMRAVPKAAVVITNPSHVAVALAYQRGSTGAPKLVAKGADEVAARIRDLARAHRIPMIANPPLARALFRIEIDTEIPPEHFRAVAEIIAYVWRMRAQAMRR
jgi:flagellar biosynthetic protein FlhB